MRPGITGPWQVNGNGSVSNFEDVVKLDCDYIDHWSLWLDAKLLLKTCAEVLKADGWQRSSLFASHAGHLPCSTRQMAGGVLRCSIEVDNGIHAGTDNHVSGNTVDRNNKRRYCDSKAARSYLEKITKPLAGIVNSAEAGMPSHSTSSV
jgi:hypothetical protein